MYLKSKHHRNRYNKHQCNEQRLCRIFLHSLCSVHRAFDIPFYQAHVEILAKNKSGHWPLITTGLHDICQHYIMIDSHIENQSFIKCYVIKNIFRILNNYPGNYYKISGNSFWLFLILENNLENQHHIRTHNPAGLQSKRNNQY